MTVKITAKIIGYSIETPESRKQAKILQMNETVEREETLTGSTYRIKTPLMPHAFYITINNIVLNRGTDREIVRPFEIFINSKNMDDFQWIVGLTRVLSAVFRKGGDLSFLIEELGSVFDPKGGYFKKGGKYMPSLVAEIGEIVEKHLVDLGLIERKELDVHQQALVDSKTVIEGPEYPPGATLCPRCQHKALMILDGCKTCLNCADSKCG